MSNESSIFDASAAQPAAPSGSATAAPASITQPNSLDNLLDTIKNERGERKYRTVEDAIVGLANAQSYIPQIKQELDSAKTEVATLKAQADKVAELEQLVMKLSRQSESEHPTKNVEISEEGIASIVDKRLTAAQKQQESQANQKLVAQAVVSKFGADKGSEVFYSKAQELGFSRDEINSLAGKSPAAVLAMLGVSGEGAIKQPNTPTASSVRSDTFNGTPTSFIGKETHKLPLGATHKDQAVLFDNAKQMVVELASKGLSIEDLTNPQTFFKHMR